MESLFSVDALKHALTKVTLEIFNTDQGEQSAFCRYAYRNGREGHSVWLPFKGFGKKPLMLLTMEPMRRNRKVLREAVEAYITRLRVEETISFIK